jgi:hypothetical protein
VDIQYLDSPIYQLDFSIKGGSFTAQDSEDSWGQEGDVEPDSCVGQVLKKCHKIPSRCRKFFYFFVHMGGCLSKKSAIFHEYTL